MNKRLIFTLIASLFFLTASTTVFSQNRTIAPVEYKGNSDKFAIMVSNARHYQAAVMTAKMMQTTEKGYQYEIVVIGKLAKELAEDASLAETIAMANKLGVKTVVCKSAMDFLGVKKEDLDKSLEITENGWIYMFELQDKGFNTLSVG